MKFLKIALFVALAIPMLITSCDKSTETTGGKYSMSFDVPDSVSYNIGLSMASYLQRQGIRSVDVDTYSEGMKAGAKLGEAPKELIDSIGGIIQEFMVAYNQEMQGKLAADSTFVPDPMDLPKDLSYNYGLLLGSNLNSQNLGKANIDELVLGVKDQFASTPKVDLEASGKILEGYFNLTDSLRVGLNEEYLAENKAKEGVVTTPSGLQYEVIRKGDGETPVATDKVRVNYKGTFINGKTFDSSYDRGEPTEFFLNQVIPGWTEGLALMPIGSHYKFTIPFDIAYGERGSQSIPPKSTLVFEVELLDIVTPPAAPEALPTPGDASTEKK